MATIKKLVFGDMVFSECSREFLISQGVPVAQVNAVESAQAIADIQDARRAAYAAESDPLFLEYQYEQTDASEKIWRDKVAEIKTRYPLPEEL